MWSLSGRLLGEGTVGPFSRPPDRVPCEEHRLESGCGEPLCYEPTLTTRERKVGVMGASGLLATYVRCGAEHWVVPPWVMKSLLHLTLFQWSATPVPPTAAGGMSPPGGPETTSGGPGDGQARGASLCTLTDALVGFAVWFSHGKMLTSLVLFLN